MARPYRGPIPHSLLEFLDQRPPALLVEAMLDRKPGRIGRAVAKSGLPRRTFGKIASRNTWAGVRVDRVDAFFRGCGMDPMHRKQADAYLRQTVKRERPFAHLNGARLKRLNERLATRAELGPD